MYDYFAFWNGATMVAFFNFVAAIMGGPDFLGLMKAIGVTGLLVASGGALLQVKGEEVGKYFAALALFQATLIVPTCTVNVWDIRAGTAVPVANVPIGVGLFASELSHLGKWLTDRYETTFGPVDEVARFSRFGLAGPQRVIEAATRAVAHTPALRNGLDELVDKCVVPELVDRPAKTNELSASTSVWTTVMTAGWLNDARSVMLQGLTSAPDGIYGCQTAANLLTSEYNVERASLLRKLGAQSASFAIGGPTPIDARMVNALEAADTLLVGASRSADAILRDAVLTDSLRKGAISGTVVSRSVALANVSSDINYRTMAIIAENALPKLRTGIEAMTLAIFPALVLIVIVTGHRAGLVIKSYVYMLAWIQLWPPLYAVVNHLSTASDGTQFSQAVNALGGTTPQAMALVAELGSSSQTTAGMFALAIPMIALALVKGGEQAFSSMTSSIMSPAQGAAQKSGADLAAGNISSGNTSWGNMQTNNSASNGFSSGVTSLNNMSGNKRDASPSWSSTGMSTQTAGAGSIFKDGGSTVFQGRTDSGALGMSSGSRQSLSNDTSSSRGTESSREARSSFESAMSSVGTTLSSTGFGARVASELDTSSSYGTSTKTGSSASAGDRATSTSGVRQGSDTSEGTAFNTGISGGAGMAGATDASQVTKPFGTGAPAQGGVPALGGPGSQPLLNGPGGPASGSAPVGAPGGGAGAGGAGGAPGWSDPKHEAPQIRRSVAGSGRVGAEVGMRSSNAMTNTHSAVQAVEGGRSQDVAKNLAAMSEAANRVAASDKTGASAEANKQFQAQIAAAAKASENYSAAIRESATSTSGRTASSGNSVEGSTQNLSAVVAAAQAQGMSDADVLKGLSRADSPQGQRLMAIRDGMAQDMANGSGPQSLSGGGGQALKAPESPSTVRSEGGSGRNAVRSQGRAGIESQNTANSAGLERTAQEGGLPGYNPGAKPDTGGVRSEASRQQGAAQAAIDSMKQGTQTAVGGAVVAEAIQRGNSSGASAPLQNLSNALLGGLGYDEPSKAISAINAVATQSPNSQAGQALRGIGEQYSTGRAVSPEQLKDAAKLVREEAKRLKVD